MHNFNLKMIKIILVILTVTIVLNMVGGIRIMKNNFYWRSQYFKLQADYLKTKLDFWRFSPSSNNFSKSNSEAKAKSVPVLLYHGIISDSSWKADQVNTSFDDFKDQMFVLKRAGWQTIKLEDYLDFSQGKKDLPEKSFMLTFDDGRKDSYYPVDPILRALDYSAVMFAITGRSLGQDNEKSPFHLSKNELEYMAQSGHWEMASHTQNNHNNEVVGLDNETGHSLSNKLWVEKEKRLETEKEYTNRVYQDLLNSKKDLENNLGIKVLAFAYPFGDFGQAYVNFPESQNVLSPIVESIFPVAFYQAGNSDFPVNYPTGSNLSKRININSPMSGQTLLKTLRDNQDKPLPYADNFSGDNGWLKGWGIIDIQDNAITIGDTQEDDSALTFLGGSYLWKDYFTEVEVNLLNVNSFALAARFQNESNFISCEFSNDYVALTQEINKESRPDIIVPKKNNLSSGRTVRVGISAVGNQAGCFLDGQQAVSGEIDSKLDHGGVGFKIWDTGQKGAKLIIRDLRVSSKNL